MGKLTVSEGRVDGTSLDVTTFEASSVDVTILCLWPRAGHVYDLVQLCLLPVLRPVKLRRQSK